MLRSITFAFMFSFAVAVSNSTDTSGSTESRDITLDRISFGVLAICHLIGTLLYLSVCLTLCVFKLFRSGPASKFVIVLVVLLGVSALVSFAWLASGTYSDVKCEIVATIYFYLRFCLFAWICILSRVLNKLHVAGDSQANKLTMWHHLIGWGGSILFLVPVLALGGLGKRAFLGHDICDVESLEFFGMSFVAAGVVFLLPGIYYMLSLARISTYLNAANENAKRDMMVFYCLCFGALGEWVCHVLTWGALSSDFESIFVLLWSVTILVEAGSLFYFVCAQKKVMAHWFSCFPGCREQLDEMYDMVGNGIESAQPSRMTVASTVARSVF